jgi:hypothetical protein
MGMVAAAQAAVNVMALALAVATGAARPADVGLALVSLMILARLAYSAWVGFSMLCRLLLPGAAPVHKACMHARAR